MLALHSTSLLSVCESIRTNNAYRLLSLRHRPQAPQAPARSAAESRGVDSPAPVLVDIDGPNESSVVPDCLWRGEDVSHSVDGAHVARISLPAVKESGHRDAPIGMDGSGRPLPQSEELDEELDEDDEEDDGATPMMTEAQLAKRGATESFYERAPKRQEVHERRVIRSAIRASDQAAAEARMAERGAANRKREERELLRQSRTRQVRESLKAGEAREGRGSAVASRISAQVAPRKAASSQRLRDPDQLIWMVKLSNGTWEPTTEEDMRPNEIHHGYESKKMAWGDLTAEQQRRADTPSTAVAPSSSRRPRSLSRVRGAASSVSRGRGRSAPAQRQRGEDDDTEFGTPKAALQLLVQGVRDYRMRFGTSPPPSMLNLVNLPRNYKSVLRKEGVYFPEALDPEPWPSAEALRDEARHTELQKEDVESYYAHARIMASLVQAKNDLEQKDEREGTPGRSADLIEWLNDQLKKHRLSCEQQYSNIRERIVRSGSMREVSATDEWKSVIEADHVKGETKEDDGPPLEPEDRSKTMVRYEE